MYADTFKESFNFRLSFKHVDLMYKYSLALGNIALHPRASPVSLAIAKIVVGVLGHSHATILHFVSLAKELF